MVDLLNIYKKVYKWTLEENYEMEVSPLFLLPDFQNEWVNIEQNHITIKRGYSWDGCSPKRKLFGIVIGTWDGPIEEATGKPQLYYPSLIHDVLTQFRIGDRKTADQIFLWLMYEHEFKYAKLYYKAVRLYGEIFDNY